MFKFRLFWGMCVYNYKDLSQEKHILVCVGVLAIGVGLAIGLVLFIQISYILRGGQALHPAPAVLGVKPLFKPPCLDSKPRTRASGIQVPTP